MQRYNYFFRQKVTEGELDSGFDAAEQMEFNLHLAQGIVGVLSEGTVAENSGTPNLTVDISGPAEIRDQLGQRVAWTPMQDVDCSVDENTNPTAVGTPGNEKYLSIFATFVRVLSDPRLDGVGDLVQFNRAEGFQINVVQGAEAALGTAARPGLRAAEILLADVILINGQTQILNADILTDRREDAFVITLASGDVHAGQFEESLQAVASQIEADAPSLLDLADDTTPDDGVTLVGADAVAGAPTALAQGTVKSQIATLLSAINSISDMALLNWSRIEQAITLVGAETVDDIAYAPDGNEHGAPQFMIVAGGQTILRSDHGEFWKSETTIYAGQGTSLANDSNSTTWVVVYAFNKIDYSTDGGATWTAATPSLAGTNTNKWVRAGNGLFVCIGGASGAEIQTSPDGINWLTRTNPIALALEEPHYADGIWVVPGGAGGIITSPDGVTWTDRSGFSALSSLKCVVYDSVNGVWFAGGNDGGLQTTTDPDAVAWTDRTATLGLTGTRIINGLATDGLGTVVGVVRFGITSDESDGIFFSRDGGATFTLRDYDFGEPSGEMRKVIYAEGAWWICGLDAEGNGMVLRSLRI